MTGVEPSDESYRAFLDAHTPEHGPCTLLVLRRGYGNAARVWVSLHGGIQATAVLDRAGVTQLNALLAEAAGARGEPGSSRPPSPTGPACPDPAGPVGLEPLT